MSLDHYQVDHGCPMSIEPGQSHTVYISESVLLKIREDTGTSRIMACVQNQLTRNKFSDPFDFWESRDKMRTAFKNQNAK